jgi:hypothetical protein
VIIGEWHDGGPECIKAILDPTHSVLVLEDAVRRYPGSIHALRRLGHARWALASALADSGSVAEGLAQIERSSADLRRVVAFDPADDDAHRHLHISENARGGILVQAGQVDAGLKLLADTVAERRVILLAHPGEARRMRDYAVEVKTLADLQAQTGRTAAACATYAEGRRVFEAMAKVDMLHVPYRGGGPALNDVMGGQVPLIWVSIPAAAQQVKAGKLRALAVSTVKRSPAFPDVPTMQEAGVADFEVDSWYAMLVPAKTPRAIIDKLNKALNTVLAEPAIRTQLLEQGADAVGGTPEALGKVIAAELPKWAKLAKDANIKAD